MEPIYLMLAGVIALWLVSFVSALVAFALGGRRSKRAFFVAITAAVTSLVTGYFGKTYFHFSYSKNTNGSEWSLNSYWFFVVSLVLGGAALLYVGWRRLARAPSPTPAAPPVIT